MYFLPFLFLIHHVMSECNGGPELCQKPYSDITYLVTHDSYALTPRLGATQDYSILDQLNDGVRGIKLSAVPFSSDPNIIQLCHTICGMLDAGPATDTLNVISGWLKENPKEIVTIMWNNLYNMKATQFASAYEASDIMPFVYTRQNLSDAWPNLQTMIDANQRLVNFVDAEADVTQVPWLMDQFSQVFETPYENIDTFNCEVDRIGQDLNPKDLMYVVNHFLYASFEVGATKIEMPSKAKANVTNAHVSLADHIQNCTSQFEKKPNFIEVDFYSIGDSLSVVAELNGVSAQQLTSKQDTKSEGMAIIHKTSLSPTEHIMIDNTVSMGNLLTPKSLFYIASMLTSVLVTYLSSGNKILS
ncbi:PLC-like phosphodiesterase [Gilbertella persicaria]|uniref:PLC-like phosphodiesterase n=1 Tax=Gilbertella persicaria TaxID=101096 RepID=UPI00221F1DCB|nr:PLC-like phosphodiesterase [Gilbertella persicaria]KAI8080704.1 PLC-like phosphodiesterase [Gilbertella persicaria]